MESKPVIAVYYLPLNECIYVAVKHEKLKNRPPMKQAGAYLSLYLHSAPEAQSLAFFGFKSSANVRDRANVQVPGMYSLISTKSIILFINIDKIRESLHLYNVSYIRSLISRKI